MKNRNRIFEAPIDEPEGFRMNPQLKSKIERGDTPYSDSPFLPKKGEGERQSFEEKAATKRFADVVGKLQRYLGVNAPRDLMGLQMTMMRTLGDIKRFESSRERQLENMAVELAENELLDPKYKGYIKFDAKFMPIGGPVNPNLQTTSQEFSSEDIEQAFAEHGEDVEEFINGSQKTTS